MILCVRATNYSDVRITLNPGGAKCVGCIISGDWYGVTVSELIDHLTTHLNRGDIVPTLKLRSLWRSKAINGDLFEDWSRSAFVNLLLSGSENDDDYYDDDDDDDYYIDDYSYYGLE